ncbi:serine hydrolase [Lysinibacillus sphaericus]
MDRMKEKDKILKGQIHEMVEDVEGRISLHIELPAHTIQMHSDVPYSAASLIKLPILLEGFRQIQEGKLDPDEVIPVTQEDKVGGAGVLSHLSPHTKVTVHDLLTLMIIVSDNTASNLLIDRMGMDSVNGMCRLLGLEQTKLSRNLMDLEALESGVDNHISATDAVKCLKAMENEDLFHLNSRESMIRILQNQQFYQKLPGSMDRDVVFTANKTGELPGVEHDCAIIRYNQQTVFAAILIDELKDNSEGSGLIMKVGKCLNEYLLT